jgi:hypothetical protein
MKYYLVSITVLTFLTSSAFALRCGDEPGCISDQIQRVSYTLKTSGSAYYCEQMQPDAVSVNNLIFGLAKKIGKVHVSQVLKKSSEVCLVLTEQ